MAETEVQHESLLLPGYWRITSFGKLTENPLSVRSDLRIRISLAPLADPEIVSPELGLLDRQIRHLLVPIGELPRLHFNAILFNGRLCSHKIRRLDLEDRITRQLDCARSNIRVFKRFDRDERGEHIIPIRSKWSDQIGDPEMHGYFVAIGSADDPYSTIIPAIEIFRFFYATSDVLAKALLRDDFLNPSERLWNPAKTAMGSDGCAVLWLRKYMLDADARFLARFAFDNYALQQAQEIFLHASVTGHHEGERMIRALPPFQDTVSTQFLCCPIGGPDGKRVVVTRFLQCDWKPPFTHLKWDRDNDGRPDPSNREERDPSHLSR